MGQRQRSKPLPKCLFAGRVSEVMRVSLQLPQEILSGRVLAPQRLERSLRSKPFHRQSPSPRGGDGECTQVRLEGPSNLTSRILNIGRSLKTSKLSIFATQKPEVKMPVLGWLCLATGQ